MICYDNPEAHKRALDEVAAEAVRVELQLVVLHLTAEVAQASNPAHARVLTHIINDIESGAYKQ